MLAEPDNSKCAQLIRRVITPLLLPMKSEIDKFKNSADKKPSRKAIDAIADCLELVGEFLKRCKDLQNRPNIGQNNPLIPIFQDLWPFIDDILKEFFFDNDITESACRCIKHSIRALNLSFTPYLNDFLRRIAQGYENSPNGSYVYALENCFSTFGDLP